MPLRTHFPHIPANSCPKFTQTETPNSTAPIPIIDNTPAPPLYQGLSKRVKQRRRSKTSDPYQAPLPPSSLFERSVTAHHFLTSLSLVYPPLECFDLKIAGASYNSE